MLYLAELEVKPKNLQRVSQNLLYLNGREGACYIDGSKLLQNT